MGTLKVTEPLLGLLLVHLLLCSNLQVKNQNGCKDDEPNIADCFVRKLDAAEMICMVQSNASVVLFLWKHDLSKVAD